MNISTRKDGLRLRPYLFCSEELSPGITEPLSAVYNIVPLPRFEKLAAPVSSHPDMLVFAGRNKLVISAQYYNINKECFEGLDIKPQLILANERTESDYPHDILLNALVMNDILFARLDSVSASVKTLFEKRVNVAQGYAACSCCRVTEKALITPDPSIARAAEQAGLEVLRIAPGHIELKGYSCGFIGGAGFSDEHAVYFFGDIETHPDSVRIRDFIASHHKKCISLAQGALYDFGGAVIAEHL